MAKEVISTSEERQVLDVSDPRERTEVLLDIVGKRGLGAFHDFCSCLEKVGPHLLTGFLLEHSGKLYFIIMFIPDSCFSINIPQII